MDIVYIIYFLLLFLSLGFIIYFKFLYKTEWNDLEGTKKKLAKKGLTTLSDFRKIINDNLVSSSEMILSKSKRQPELLSISTYFGGCPQMKSTDAWPENLSFICQIVNNGNNNLPEDIAMIQFFCDIDNCEYSPDGNGDSWLVKTYKKSELDDLSIVETPRDVKVYDYCEVEFRDMKIYQESPISSDLGWVLSYEFDVEAEVEKIAPQKTSSRIGGAPTWIQGEELPGKGYVFVMQIKSENNSGFMWGDAGAAYIFRKGKDYRMVWQCY